MPSIGTCFRFYKQMQVEKKNKAFAYKIYSHFTQQCTQCGKKIETFKLLVGRWIGFDSLLIVIYKYFVRMQ